MNDVERNVENVRRLEEAFNGRDYSLLGDLISAGFEGHNPGSNTVTVEGLTDNNESWHGAMPDKGTQVTFAFGSGDRVVARIRDRGTNTGGDPWLGIRPTARRWTWTGSRSPVTTSKGGSSRCGLWLTYLVSCRIWAQPSVGAIELPPEELETSARRFFELIFNDRNLSLADEMLAANFVEHLPPLSDPVSKPIGANSHFSKRCWTQAMTFR